MFTLLLIAMSAELLRSALVFLLNFVFIKAFIISNLVFAKKNENKGPM